MLKFQVISMFHILDGRMHCEANACAKKIKDCLSFGQEFLLAS